MTRSSDTWQTHANRMAIRATAAIIAGASVFGGEHERDAALAKEIEREELGARSRAVEQRGFDTSCDERLGEDGERGEPDASCNQTRFTFSACVDHRPGEAKRSEAGDALAG